MQLFHTAVGYVTHPKESETGGGFFVRAELPKCSDRIRSLVLAGDAIRRYFYQMDRENESATLYKLLEASESATRLNSA
jgi:hypothetical protein